MANHVVSGQYQNGQLFFEMSLTADGIKNGPFFIYHENGQLMMESYWSAGRLQGPTIFRDRQGNIEQEAQFAAGILVKPN